MRKRANDDGGDPNPDDPRYNIVLGEVGSILMFNSRQVIFYKNEEDYITSKASWRRRFNEKILPPFPCNGGVIIFKAKSNEMLCINNEGVTI